MSDDFQVDQDEFDAVLRRMAIMKPLSVKELSARLKAEKEAKRVQKMDKLKLKPAQQEREFLRGRG